MDIVYKNPNDLIPYVNNAKQHDANNVKNIATSIKKYGFKQPVVIDKDGVLVVGHGRVLAALQLKLDSVPCVIADDLTDEQIREYRLLDNKLNESPWDMEFLKLELEDLDFGDFEIEFDLDVPEEEPEAQEDDFDVEDNIPDEPISRLGDIWELGRRTDKL